MTTAATITTKLSAKSRHDASSDRTINWRPKNPAKQNSLIDIIIPMYNEAHVVTASLEKLTTYLETSFPYNWQITLVDSGSTDATWETIRQLAMQPHVQALRVAQKGRGRALKQAWLQSKADVLMYMDVDLSADLDALAPLVQPLIEGEAAIATGSRLRKDSQVVRSPKRELISRAYNFILHRRLQLKTSDAQCGFKAIRADVARKLLPEVSDNDWFFDTELLAKAERAGLQVHEVGVAWQEDKDSRVKILQTAKDDLKGIRRLRQEFSDKAKWERWTLGGILGSTFGLYLFGALQNGYGNSFYAAAVQAGTASWKAMFFGSIDGSSFISVDKPPFSLWVMEASTRIFGFHAWSMMLPEVLCGVATVYLVYAIVRRWFSAVSAITAAGVMALTPVAAMMFGFNNPDAVLTLLLTGSMYTFIRAIEGKRALFWLSMTGVLIGCAFNTKMLQGIIVLPAMVLIYLFLAPPKFLIRLKQLLVSLIPLAAATLWWPIIVALVPVANRPYIGSSTDNSIWNLIFGYNGLGRLLGKGSGQGGGGGMGGFGGTGGGPGQLSQTMTQGAQQSLSTTTQSATQGFAGGIPGGGMGGAGGGHGPGGSGFGGSTGIFRMFNSDFGPNIAWFLLLALISLGFGLWLTRNAKRDDRTRIAFLAWGGWLVLHIIIFSMVSGVIHPYYPVVMAPAIAGLVGMGVPLMIEAYRKQTSAAIILPISVAITGIMACVLLGDSTTWLPWLRWTILIVSLGAAVGMILQLIAPARKFVNGLLVTAVIACGIAPTAFSLATVTVAHTGSIPTAGPSATAMQGSNNESASAEASFVTYLLAHRGSAKWIVAVASANESASIQISSGAPVMAVGGFNGSDNALKVAQLQKLISSGQLKYYAVTSGGQSDGAPGGGNSTVLTWIKAHGTKVNYGGSTYTLYDLSN